MKLANTHNIAFSFYFVVCITLISFSYNYPEKFSQPRNIIIKTTQPLIKILSIPSLWINDTYQATILHFDTVNKNIQLTKQNKILSQWYKKSTILKQENNRLKELLGNITKNVSKPLLVEAFTDASSPFARSILINAGANSGIKKGQEVVNYQGLVGRIINVFPTTARVLLITDSTFRLPARILENRSRALIKGTNGPKLEIMIIENSRAKTYSGMTAVTSGMGGTFIPNIAVGEIKKSGKGYIVIPDVDFSKLENLIVHRHTIRNVLEENNE